MTYKVKYYELEVDPLIISSSLFGIVGIRSITILLLLSLGARFFLKLRDETNQTT